MTRFGIKIKEKPINTCVDLQHGLIDFEPTQKSWPRKSSVWMLLILLFFSSALSIWWGVRELVLAQTEETDYEICLTQLQASEFRAQVQELAEYVHYLDYLLESKDGPSEPFPMLGRIREDFGLPRLLKLLNQLAHKLAAAQVYSDPMEPITSMSQGSQDIELEDYFFVDTETGATDTNNDTVYFDVGAGSDNRERSGVPLQNSKGLPKVNAAVSGTTPSSQTNPHKILLDFAQSLSR